jgi:hypothetical protein
MSRSRFRGIAMSLDMRNIPHPTLTGHQNQEEENCRCLQET